MDLYSSDAKEYLGEREHGCSWINITLYCFRDIDLFEQ